MTETEYKNLFDLLDVDAYSDNAKLQLIGKLFDGALDCHDRKGIERGFTIIETINYDTLSSDNKILYHYFSANAWSTLKRFNQAQNQNGWDYDQEELTKEIFHLRKCISIEGFKDIMRERQCQVYTNLGLQLLHIGRFVEAVELWHKALAINATFPMALGSMGSGLYDYAVRIYDSSHQGIFVYHSYTVLKKAVKYQKQLHKNPYNAFLQSIAKIEKSNSVEALNKSYNFNSFDLGEDQELRTYRQWGLQNTLYLNPINDLAAYTVASHDCLHLPEIVVKAGEPPKHYILFNQIKQEYATARFLLYEGTTKTDTHYSDCDTVLYDTADYSAYSFNIEKIKISYRLLYSIFDKVAYLLNNYLELEIKRSQISFKTLWKDKKDNLRPIFSNNNNLALRGLYWLSKDLFNEEDAFNQLLEPASKELADIRNHIEHKSFRVQENGTWGQDDQDGFTFAIDRHKFEQKT